MGQEEELRQVGTTQELITLEYDIVAYSSLEDLKIFKDLIIINQGTFIIKLEKVFKVLQRREYNQTIEQHTLVQRIFVPKTAQVLLAIAHWEPDNFKNS